MSLNDLDQSIILFRFNLTVFFFIQTWGTWTNDAIQKFSKREANKTSKLQTELGTYHLQYDEINDVRRLGERNGFFLGVFGETDEPGDVMSNVQVTRGSCNNEI